MYFAKIVRCAGAVDKGSGAANPLVVLFVIVNVLVSSILDESMLDFDCPDG